MLTEAEMSDINKFLSQHPTLCKKTTDIHAMLTSGIASLPQEQRDEDEEAEKTATSPPPTPSWSHENNLSGDEISRNDEDEEEQRLKFKLTAQYRAV